MIKNKKTLVLYVLAGLFLAYSLAGFLLVPWIIRTQMLKQLPVVLDRTVLVEKVRFNPYTLGLQIEGLEVDGRDGQPLLRVGRIAANAQVSSVIFRGLVLRYLKLEDPYIRISRDAQGVLSFNDLLDRRLDQSGPEEVPDEAGPGIPMVRIGEFSFLNGTFVFEDASTAEPYRKEIRSIQFVLNDLSTEADKSGTFQFGAQSELSEVFSWEGNLSVNPLVLSGKIGIKSLDLPKFMPYVSHLLDGKVESGYLTVDFDYSLQLESRGLDLVLSAGMIGLEQFSLITRESPESLVAWQNLLLDNISADLLDRTVEIGTLHMERSRILVHRYPDGRFNFQKAYIPQPVSEEESATDSGTGLAPDGWKLRLLDLSLTDAGIRLFDEGLQSPSDLRFWVPRLHLQGLSNIMDERFELSLELANDGPGLAEVEAAGSLIPLSAELAISLREWSLTNLNAYLAEFATARLVSGDLSMALKARFGEQLFDTLELGGDLGLDNLDIRDSRQDQPLAGWKAFAISGIEYFPARDTLSVSSISLRQPELLVRIEADGSPNLLNVLRLPDAAEPAEPTEPASSGGPPADTWLDQLAIEDARFRFEDARQIPAAKLSLDSLNVKMKGLSSDLAARPELHVDGKVMGKAPLKVDGTLNFLIDHPYLDATVSLQELEMSPFAPYFSRYVGYRLQRGSLNLNLDYKVEDQQLESENVLLLNKLTLGQRTDSPDATSLPVSLAIALLKDAAGNIKIDMPIDGDLSDPNFRWGGVVLQTIGNLMIRLAASPFSILGSLVGASAEDLQFVTFDPGSHVPGDSARKSLTALARALTDRPGINIELTATIEPSIEIAQLRRSMLKQQLLDTFGGTVPEGVGESEAYAYIVPQAYQDLLREGEAPAEMPTLEKMELELLQEIPVSGEDLSKLAKRRMEAVRDYLVKEHSIAPERVVIAGSDTLANSQNGASEIHISIH